MGDQQSAKKPRLAAEPLLHATLKQETAVHQAAGDGGGAVVAAADHGSRMDIAVKMDVTLLHCPICISPLKPPVFQCKGGHVACGLCLADPCEECGGAFDARNAAMDTVVSSTTTVCDHDGCGRYVTYHKLAGHHGECSHAPCACTVPGCGFAGPAPALLGHLTTLHAMPVHRVQYGKVLVLQVSTNGASRAGSRWTAASGVRAPEDWEEEFDDDDVSMLLFIAIVLSMSMYMFL